MEYSFELNNARNDSTAVGGKITAKSPVVEVFSAMADGKELGSLNLGKKADVAAKYIQDLGKKASAGDTMAISEINEIRKFVMQPRVLQELKLFSVFGSYKPLGWNETPYLEKITHENVKAEIQAEGQDVATPFIRKTKTALAPVTISGGHRVNYRELALGDASTERELMNEVQTQIRNKATAYVIETIYKAIESATGVKYFLEEAGLTKTGVDAFLTKIRRYGKPNVQGDYAVLAQFLPWIGYAGTVGGNAISGVSQKLLDEISDTGLIGTYNGAVLKEIPNGYDFNKLTADGTNYQTLLPAGLAFVTPTAPAQGVSPIQLFSVGGLTSMSGSEVSSGDIMTRYDIRLAAGVAQPDAIGVIHDKNLDDLA